LKGKIAMATKKSANKPKKDEPFLPYKDGCLKALDSLKDMGGDHDIEQHGMLATISNLGQANPNAIVLQAKAIGFVNALYDEKRKRVAIPLASYYPGHDIAVHAQGQLE